MKVETKINIGDLVVITDKDGRYYGEVTEISVRAGGNVRYSVKFWKSEVVFDAADVKLFDNC